MQYLLLFRSNNGYANVSQCYVYTCIAYLRVIISKADVFMGHVYPTSFSSTPFVENIFCTHKHLSYALCMQGEPLLLHVTCPVLPKIVIGRHSLLKLPYMRFR
jgi:hypothetical protein